MIQTNEFLDECKDNQPQNEQTPKTQDQATIETPQEKDPQGYWKNYQEFLVNL